ncbi:MAG TPA: hypothetical protein PLE74_01240 [Candidatus Cloacimonadota bacterium]|nr:hypothetical protein [Candidatus Cloacimonadota bacterium]
MTDTQTIHKIVDESVEKAFKAREQQCKLHADRLNSFENNQKDMVKEMQETNKLLAVVNDNIQDIKKNRDQLFDKSNTNSRLIAEHTIKIDNQDKKIEGVEVEIKESKTLKWTAVIAITTVIIEFLINRFGGK